MGPNWNCPTRVPGAELECFEVAPLRPGRSLQRWLPSWSPPGALWHEVRPPELASWRGSIRAPRR